MPQYTKLHQKYGFKDLREEAISHFMEVSKNEIELGELGIKPDPERMFVSIFGPRHHPFNNSIADLAKRFINTSAFGTSASICTS